MPGKLDPANKGLDPGAMPVMPGMPSPMVDPKPLPQQFDLLNRSGAERIQRDFQNTASEAIQREIVQSRGMPEVKPPSAIPIQPVPRQRVDGRQWGKQFIQRAFGTPLPGETPEDMAWRIRQSNLMTQKLDQIPGDLTPEEAQAALMDHYEGIMGPVEIPVQTFSPDAQAALRDLFAPDPEQPTLGIGDIDEAELMAALGYAVGGLFKGGSFGDALLTFDQVRQRGQQKVDTKYQQDLEAAKLRRQAAIEKWKRVNQIEDANFTQRGYDARDQRTLQRQKENADAIADREASRGDATFRREMARQYFGFLASGDPARAAQVKAFYESETGQKVDDSFSVLAPTVGQRVHESQVRQNDANTLKALEALRGMGLDNDLKEATFSEQVYKVFLGNRKAAAEIEQIQKETEFIPEKYRSEIARTWMGVLEGNQRIASMKMRDETDRIEAQNKSGDASGASRPTTDRTMTDLRGIFNGIAKQYDDYAQSYKEKVAEWNRAESDLYNAKLKGEPTADLERSVQSLRDQARSIKSRMDDLQKKMDDNLKRQEDFVNRGGQSQTIPPGYVSDGMGGIKPAGSAK